MTFSCVTPERWQESKASGELEAAIETNALTKTFGDFKAVDNVSLTVKKGEIFGFLGPNGAGKSTTIKMLTTLLYPTSGSAKICGYDIVEDRDQVRSSIGIVFQDRSSDWWLTGRENLDFHSRMYNVSSEERKRRMEEVLALLDLKGKENVKLHDLPEGVRRRFEVARGFMTYPEVVFLDEPTIGFDIKARMDLWAQIKKARATEGVTVSLTTHYIEEADYLCDRVAIIDQGKIIAMDTPARLKEAVGMDLISLGMANPKERRAEFIERVRQLAWIRGVEEYGTGVLLDVERGDGRVAELVDFAEKHGFVITSVDEREPNLEDVFVQLTGRTIREAEGAAKDMALRRNIRRAGRR
jgi:ABC-2 type transport system ATP-binding protein